MPRTSRTEKEAEAGAFLSFWSLQPLMSLVEILDRNPRYRPAPPEEIHRHPQQKNPRPDQRVAGVRKVDVEDDSQTREDEEERHPGVGGDRERARRGGQGAAEH